MLPKQTAVGLSCLLSLSCPALAIKPRPEATATATKGPVQLTLRLYKNKVKVDKSLWYQIELKNVSRKPIQIMDTIFRDPWAIRYNIRDRVGIYIDIQGPPGVYKGDSWPPDHPSGDSPQMRMPLGSLGMPYKAWHSKGYSEEDKKELAALEQKWKKEGLSETEQVIAKHHWQERWMDKKDQEEGTDPADIVMLAPGASTTTLSWAYRDPDPSVHHDALEQELADEEPQVGDYAQLFDYWLRPPGKYKIRVVYNHGFDKESRHELENEGIKIPPWYVHVETPYIPFEVVK